MGFALVNVLIALMGAQITESLEEEKTTLKR